MFVRDNELRRGGGNRDERARVLQLAKEQRAARSQLKEHDAVARKLQAFLRGRTSARHTRAGIRRDVDQKLADIAQLKLLLQLPNMPLPFDALFDLLRKLLFTYRSASLDFARAQQLALLLHDAVAANGHALEAVVSQRRWLLERFIDVCVQPPAPPQAATAPSLTPTLRVVQQLGETSSELRTYILTGALATLEALRPSSSCSALLYCTMPKQSLALVVRQWLVRMRRDRETTGASGVTASVRTQCNDALALLVHLVEIDHSRSFRRTFVSAILSLPLLHELVVPDTVAMLATPTLWSLLVAAANDSLTTLTALPEAPVAGIASATWLLGNVLFLSDRVAHKTPALALAEVQLLTTLLQVVPLETFAGSGGVAVSWTHVSASHLVPVVFPDALTDQLAIILRDRYVRTLADQLLWLDESSLRAPLDTARPVPMHPAALSLAEQYGFGDIASETSLAASLSTTWKRVKAIGRASWARSLLEKTGLRRKQRNDFDDATDASAGANKTTHARLRNTSSAARRLAASGAAGDEAKAAAAGERKALGDPFALEHVRAFACLWTTFLYRWGRQHNAVQVHGMKLLNTLAFYQCARHDERCESTRRGSSDDRVSLVRFLWCVLQEASDFDAFAKDVDLVRVSSADPYICTLALFCATYNHLLVVLDDEEMYDDEFPLPLAQVERIVKGLKRALHAAYWLHGHVSQDASVDSATMAFGMFVVDSATTLLRDLYSRCSRQPFCNVTSWIIPELDSTQLIDEVIAGTPRANKLMASMPYLVPFPDRVKLFQRIVAVDKAMHQGDGSTAYRVRIRRAMILEDGLAKLNGVQSSLKKRINVVFVNAAGREEVGIDAGGLFKEFWLDLSALAFDLEYGLFLTTAGDQLLYPNPFSASAHFARESDHLTLFQFVGRILGKALYEGIVVEPKFARFFLSKLLHAFNYVHDLPSLDPEIYKNLMFLKTYDGDVEDLGLTHTIVQDIFGEQREVELVPGGGAIPVTAQNRTRYIHLVAHYYLNTQIRAQCAAFRAGLSDLIDVRWLQMFNEPELQVLISGKSGQIDVDDLRAHAKYAGGYYALDKRVQWLWQALASFTPSEQAAFLRFATSCQRAPSLGFSSLTPPFCVQKVAIRADDELLPSSSTCFNTLKLPTYSSYKVLRAKLLLSISSGAGFEMT